LVESVFVLIFNLFVGQVAAKLGTIDCHCHLSDSRVFWASPEFKGRYQASWQEQLQIGIDTWALQLRDAFRVNDKRMRVLLS
jgi:hypothetical protein